MVNTNKYIARSSLPWCTQRVAVTGSTDHKLNSIQPSTVSKCLWLLVSDVRLSQTNSCRAQPPLPVALTSTGVAVDVNNPAACASRHTAMSPAVAWRDFVTVHFTPVHDFRFSPAYPTSWTQ